MSEAFWPLFLFLSICLVLMAGYPVALTLSGVALIFAGAGSVLGVFDPVFLQALPNRLYGIMTNGTLLAVPLFVFMGVMLERSKIAQSLLENIAGIFGSSRGGLGFAVLLVGMLMAASTGIVGATVVTMGLLSLPTMLKHGYSPQVATGTICAAGTLGQIIPPSIVLVLLGDVLSNAYQQAQLKMGVYSPETVSVTDLFMGALIPGLLLVALYFCWILILTRFKPDSVPAVESENLSQSLWSLVQALAAPLFLILAVLGSILGGLATPTEAAAVGAVGASVLAWQRKALNLETLRAVSIQTLQVTSMVFMILIGASIFSLVFRGLGGDDVIHGFLSDLPGGVLTATLVVMLIMFLLGFVLDFIEITFVVVPIVGPVLLAMGLDPVWLGIMIAINLQTSFLTPPFGFALFYLRGVADRSIRTVEIYRGVMPFIVIQVLVLIILSIWPELATWLPDLMQS